MLGDLLSEVRVEPWDGFCCVCGAGPVEVVALYRGARLVACGMPTEDEINGWVFDENFELCCRKHASDRLTS